MKNDNNTVVDREEAERGFEVIREAIAGARSIPDPHSLWQLTEDVRSSLTYILASVLDRRSPPIKEWSTWPVLTALRDPDERPAFLDHAMYDTSDVEEAFELVDVFDSVAHQPERWPEFEDQFRELEVRLLARFERGDRCERQ